MSLTFFAKPIAFLYIFPALISCQQFLHPEKQESISITNIQWSQLLYDVQIVGKLGCPVGTVVDIEGEWMELAEEMSKPSQLVFEISKVNGKTMELPVQFSSVRPIVNEGEDSIYRPRLGEVWLLRAIETGGIVGLPQGVLDEMDVPVAPLPYGFSTRIMYIDIRRVP